MRHLNCAPPGSACSLTSAGHACSGWDCTDPSTASGSLQQDVVATLRRLGFAVGDDPYHPHITLGRVRNDDGERVRLRDLPDAVKGRFVDQTTGAAVAPRPVPVAVREVVLMRSHLGKGGARHEPIASFPLGGLGSDPR